jgi:aldehyde dehydrogenase (NAD+)/phenylacetaldehyde dehydrogenase
MPETIQRFLDGAESSIVIDGQRRPSSSGETIDSYDPATGEVAWRVAAGDRHDVDAAVVSAGAAFEDVWKEFKPAARARLLFDLADLVEDNADELAMLETVDVGKPFTESRNIDLVYAAEILRYFGGWATKMTGDVLPVSPPLGEAFVYTRREPLGVVAAIVPWNFPLLFYTFKLGPALAAGNTVVIKPSELTSLTAIRLAELALEAGFPPGVVNVVTGYGGGAGQALIEHPGVARVTFTGSTATGKRILESAAGTLKKVSLELGGKSGNIIFDDADVDAAVQGSIFAIFWNQGEVCCAGSRLFVHERLHDQVVDGLSGAADSIRLGHGLADDTEMGPLVSEAQLQRVLGFVESGQAQGATVAAGGTRAGGDLAGGYFVRPTIFTDVKDDMRIATEEIFGPVLSVLPFSDEDEAVRRVNASPYGLAAGVWTQDLRRAHRVAARLQAGTVWVNTYNVADPSTPFGGYKDSGFGRDLGLEALHSFTQTKAVWMNLD